MEQQTFRNSFMNQLKAKQEENTTYRKALTIYQSILQSTKDISNFQQNYANTDSNFALFLFGSAFKLLMKANPNMAHNIDSLLLIINQSLPILNVGTIKTTGILKQLQRKIFFILKNPQSQLSEKTPLTIRLGVSILSYTLINSEVETDSQASKILCQMFDSAVESHRTNILSKQASKMITHIIRDNANLAKILSKHANMTMLQNLQTNLYLNNVREVISQFSPKLINDIGYRVCKHLSTIQCSTDQQETYLAQTYFFLEKLSPKFSSSTLQQICRQLVRNIPSSAQSESKVLFCYIQALHAVFQAFLIMNENQANKFLSVIVSILQQFITKGGRIQKQAAGVLKSLMSGCIRKSLWVNAAEDQEIDIDNLGLEQKRGNSFSKIIYMLQGMLSEQYPNYKNTASIIGAFFDSLDRSALNQVLGLIDKIVKFRDNFDEKSFKKLMHSIFGSISIENLCRIYKIDIKGDISQQKFEQNNSLWLVYCTQKYDGQEQFSTFMTYYYPLLISLKSIINENKNLTPIRKQAYKNLLEMVWRCLKVFCRKPMDNYNYQPIIQAIKKEITSASDSTLDHISMALESLCSNLYNKRYECKWSGNLISILAKNLDIEKSNAKQILLAIKYLSLIADKQYLTRVFDKNILKLLQQKQQQKLTSLQNFQTNLKNLQILIAVSKGINFYDPSVVAPYRISREELVVKLIGELINEDSLFQKKAYKYMFETVGIMGDGYLTQVIQLLEANEHKINAASKHYRLAILGFLWKRLSQNEQKINQSFQFMKKHLPEILMNMRQSNQRTRKQSTQIFESFCQKIIEMDLMQSFVQIMCAGLAVDSYETKISTLSGLAQIYYKKYELPMQFSIGILQIVLMLLYEQKSQIYKAVIDFSRRFIFSFEKTKQINHILSTILQQLFKSDEGSKLQNRSVLKHFLLKLTKRFGRELIQKTIPAQDRKILSNAIKTQNRQKRKKKQRLMQKRLDAQNAKKQQQESDDQNYENDQASQGHDMSAEQQLQQLQQFENTDNLLLKYDLQKQNFHFEEDKVHLKNKQKKQNKNKKDGEGISFQDGMMVVRQDPRRTRQRRLHEQEQGEEDENQQARAFVNVRKRRKLNDVHEVKESGATFRSERAGGDVRIKDKPQPYAFIQFNSKALNKRFKKRAEKVFDTIFERKEGGLKGIKSKIASRRH